MKHPSLKPGLTITLSALLVASCGTSPPDAQNDQRAEASGGKLMPGIAAPDHVARSGSSKGRGNYSQTTGPGISIELAEVPRQQAQVSDDLNRGGDRIGSPFTDAQVVAAQAIAQQQPFSPGIQNLDGSQKPVGKKPKLRSSFDSIDVDDCCTGTGFGTTVPPDPDMAAGPDHLIVVVNTSFEIYDKEGNSLSGGPIQFATFFDPTSGGTNPGAGTPTPGCTAFAFQFGAQRSAVFDPDVVYDEAEDRFVIGIDGNGDSYCVAATATGDPTGAWHRYGFQADFFGPTDTPSVGAFFDFPHMGVGVDAIFMGSNQFGPGGFAGGRIFAMDKFDMYAGDPLDVVNREAADGPNVRFDSTPQPAQLHGVFPASGSKHYIMTEYFDGKTHSVYSWADPFGDDEFDLEGDVDLAAASGVPCENFSCFPVPWPQRGSPEIIQANDFRGQETEWQNGLLWTTQTVSCNPKSGTRNCVRWAQIDPTQVVEGVLNPDGSLDSGVNGVIQANVFGRNQTYRTFPSIAANACNDMVVGYSVGGPLDYPSIFAAGRSASDPLGRIGGERRLLKGDTAYRSFQDNGGVAPVRWGDYTGMTIAPDGKTFYYVGEYAKEDVSNTTTNWATFVGEFEMQGCAGH